MVVCDEFGAGGWATDAACCRGNVCEGCASGGGESEACRRVGAWRGQGLLHCGVGSGGGDGTGLGSRHDRSDGEGESTDKCDYYAVFEGKQNLISRYERVEMLGSARLFCRILCLK